LDRRLCVRLESSAVSGGAPKLTAFLVTGALLAAGVSACGGGDDSTTANPGGTGHATTAESGSARSPQGRGDGGGAGAEEDPGEGGDAGSPGSTGSQDSGGGSGQFRAPGGDNSVQNFGEEASESELERAAAALHGFLDARAGEDWATACSYLAAAVQQQLDQLAAQSKQLKGKSCAAILAGLTGGLPRVAGEELAEADVGSLRTEGDRGFLLYHGAGGTDYTMLMANEGGTWKVAALAPVPLG
jgi:hypothetical protein